MTLVHELGEDLSKNLDDDERRFFQMMKIEEAKLPTEPSERANAILEVLRTESKFALRVLALKIGEARSLAMRWNLLRKLRQTEADAEPPVEEDSVLFEALLAQKVDLTSGTDAVASKIGETLELVRERIGLPRSVRLAEFLRKEVLP